MRTAINSDISTSLIERFTRGDERAFRTLFEAQLRPLCYFARRLIGQKEEAEDVVSTAFVKLWERHADFNSFPAIQSFLYTTVRNRCIDILKHRGVAQEAGKFLLLTTADQENLTEARVLQAELLQLIMAELRRLPDNYRLILEWSFLEELGTGEIAQKLGMTEAHVRMNKSRALVQLRRLLQEKQLLPVALLLLSLLQKK